MSLATTLQMLGRGGAGTGRPRAPMFRSAGFRFGILYAALFGLSALTLAAFLWWTTVGLLDRQTDAAINADTQGLAERYQEGGLPALIETIDQRLAANIDDDAIYLLVGPRFDRIAGNLNAWPRDVTMDTNWFELPVQRAGLKGVARLHEYNLEGGFHLLVGRDSNVRSQLRRLLTGALLWSAVVALGLGTLGGALVRGAFRATVADVSATAAAIAAGDLSRRVRLAGTGDEFDLLAAAVNDMLDRILRLMDGVKQVSNAIAHDLRTPIARARTRLEDAAIHAKTPEELHAAIERAQADLDGVVGVFHAILRIAEIEAGARRSAFDTFDISALIADMAELYAAPAEDAGLRLDTSIQYQLSLHGDRDMIQQAVANLLDNAIKFSPDGAAVELTLAADKGGLRIEVADRGPGIPEADRGRATERFFRGEQARSTPGSGLGLALVQAVATLHGGTLALADNAPGLRATLTIPAATMNAAS
jgi:signal transduction histidine kinase